jgi:hypothetical protein
MADLYLSANELADLTGLSQGAAQIRWLQKNGVRHFVRADGKPRVPRQAVTDADGITARCADIQPNFDAVRVGQ